MMQERSILMPKMGESVMEATIIKWLKKEGETITESDSLVEVATDKVDSAIASPYTGQIKKILVQPGYIVPIGNPIATILVNQDTQHEPTPLAIEQRPTPISQDGTRTNNQPPVPTNPIFLPSHDYKGRSYSPLVRHIAKQAQLSPAEVSSIPGSGPDNRLTKKDLQHYLAQKNVLSSPITPANKLQPTAKSPIQTRPGDAIIPLSRIRTLIANRMVEATQTIPHVTSFVEADVTNLVTWRETHKNHFKTQAGITLTYMPIFLQAIAQALIQFPAMNALLLENHLIQRKAINIGIAVAIDNSNLVVPVIKGADRLDLISLAIQLHALAHKARHNELLPDDITEGTYTVSNIGSFQNLMGTPIIFPPQVGILALGAITKKPGVISTPTGDQIAIRHTMYLSHTYDHRVVDGALGGQFVKNVADRLENFDVNQPI